jgi:uncharacterized membrane protein
MPESIELIVAPTSLKAARGESTDCNIALSNRGKTVDQITLAVEGIDPGWYNLPVSSVALFPNDKDNAKLIIRIPENVESTARWFPFRIKAISQENPAVVVYADLTLEIRSAPLLEAAITPETIKGRKGTFQVSVNNPDDREAKVNFKASSPRNRLRFAFRPDSLTLAGGGKGETSLDVRLSWMTLLFGGKTNDFQVNADQLAGEQEKNVLLNGHLVYTPWYLIFSKIRIPWIARPPAIKSFEVTTDDKRDFRLKWMVQRAVRVKLGDADVEAKGESLVHPAEVTQYVLSANNRHGVVTRTLEISPLPVPQARTSAKISLSLSPLVSRVQAGIMPAQAIVEVKNTSDIVDKFRIEVEGVDASWYNRSASTIALMPQATDRVQIMFQPQKKKGVRAGIYPFGITVSSQSTASESATILGQLEILPAVEFKTKIRPFRLTGMRKGAYMVNLANTGVSDADITLEACDLDEGCKFQFKPAKLLLGAWNSIDVPLTIRPKRNSIIGQIKRFDVTLTAGAEGGTPQTVTCEFNHSPLMKSWKPIWRAIKLIIVIAVIVIAIYYILKVGGGWAAFRESPKDWFNHLIRTIEGWF